MKQQFSVIEEEFINSGEFIAQRVGREYFVKTFRTFEEKISSLAGCLPKNKNSLEGLVVRDFKKIYETLCENDNFSDYLGIKFFTAINKALPHLASKNIAYFMGFISFLAEIEGSKEIFMRGIEQIIKNDDSSNVEIYHLSLMCNFLSHLDKRQQERLAKCILTKVLSEDDFGELESSIFMQNPNYQKTMNYFLDELDDARINEWSPDMSSYKSSDEESSFQQSSMEEENVITIGQLNNSLE